MKTRTIIITCLSIVVVLAVGYEYSQAQPRSNTSNSKIGIVSIMEVFRDSKKCEAHRSSIIAEQNKVRAEMEKLAKQIEAEEAGLKALRPDSIDYLAQRKELIDKRSRLTAQQEFNKDNLVLKEYRFSKQFYEDILELTSDIAKEMGLDLVLTQDQIDSLALSVNEISNTIRNHKVLYGGGCIDITKEVIARLDKK